MTASKERAEQIILEILRNAGKEGLGKIKLYKVFWIAHLFYAADNRGFLSDWKIVRMPRGPGINNGNLLLQELAASKNISQTEEPVGPFREIRCRYLKGKKKGALSSEAIVAIKSAFEFIKGATATELSDMSHEYSRSWRETPEGEELDIYTDPIPDEEFQERKQSLAQIVAGIDDIFK